MFQKKQFLLLIVSLTSILVFAQEREKDTLITDVINVIKPYSPTISDAFKVKEMPTLDDVDTATKKEVKYNIFSFPVASTFTPTKGKAAVVDKTKKVKLFDNYASLAVGTYTTIIGEAYVNHEIGRGQNLIAELSHHSSAGGIDGLLTDDDFLDSNMDLTWMEKCNGFDWSLTGGFGLQSYNWYGIQQPTFTQVEADAINVNHNFTNVHVLGALNIDDGIFRGADILFRRFGDNQGSAENRLSLSGEIDVPIKNEIVSTVVSLDYLNGNFQRNYYSNTEINYGNIQFGLAPTYLLKKENFTVNLGVTLTYLNDTEASKSSFFIYPNISVNYSIVDEVVVAFGGVNGGLIQNSYYGFATENPFVSPTLFITPTDQQYNAYIGLKGKLSNTIGYSISGSSKSEKGKALFQNNLVPYGFDNNESYHYGNSFGIKYDDVTTLAATGALNVDINRNFTLGLKGEYFVYNTKNEAEAWNLPDFKGSILVDYQINKNWFTGLNLFFVGKRKDLAGFNVVENSSLPIFLNPTSVVTLDGYLDANANVGYHVNDRISVFVKGNNLVGENYNKWQNTPVQGIQFLAGGTYEFDF